MSEDVERAKKPRVGDYLGIVCIKKSSITTVIEFYESA